MQITAIEIYHAQSQLIYPFRTAFGNDFVIEKILVKLTSGQVHAWGEAAPWAKPAYSPESAAGCFLTAKKFIAPLLLNQNIASGDELQKLLSCIKGNNFAKAAFDTAWWGLKATISNKPLWQQIGGVNATIDSGEDFGILDSTEMLIEKMHQAVKRGYKRVKLKYRPGWELNMLEPVRQEFPELPIHIDCNSAYTLDDMEMFKKIDQYNLAMIEQPLMHDDLIDHATLQKQLKTPICLDESITSPTKARQAIAIGACQVINIKPGRVGGITNALKIHDIAMKNNVPCWIGGMLESSIGAHYCLALASLPNIKYPADIFPTDRFFSRDLAQPPMEHCSPGCFALPTCAGVGASPDLELLETATIDKCVMR
jgi:o-succinylbenzoate synthase